MNKLFVAALLILLLVSFLGAIEPHFTTDPEISPDGNQVCFVYHGDLWLVPFTGGTAKRLTATEANEYGPCWSPDGKSIAFSANREGLSWTYVIPATGGTAQPVFKDGMTVCDWFSDSNSLLCAKSNLSWGTSLYKTQLNGSKPVMIAEIGDYTSCLSPDNKEIIFNRYGDAYRESYKGSTNGDLWKYNINKKQYTRLTETDYTERYPRYSFTSDSVYFCASDGIRYQIYKANRNDLSKKTQLTSFTTWSARDISIAHKNDNLVFEFFDTIWCYSPTKAGEQIYKLQIEIAEDNWTDYNKEDIVTDNFDNYSVSDNDLLLAFRYKYDLFVMPRKGGEVKQITYNQNGVDDIAFLPDNRTVIYSQFSEGVKSLFSARIDSTIVINSLSWFGSGKYNVDSFYKSSDYHWVIEYTDSLYSGRIAVADSMFNDIKPIITDKFITSAFVFSPDGKMAVYVTTRDDVYSKELYLYDALTGTHKKVMNEDNRLFGLHWLPDQKSILMSRSNIQQDISRLDLVPRDDYELDTDNWKEILTKTDTVASADSIKAKPGDSISPKKPIKKVEKAKLLFSEIDWFQLDKRIYPIISDAETVYAIKAIDDTSFYYIKDIQGKEKKSTVYKANIMGKYSTEVVTLPDNPNLQIVNDNLLYYKDSNKLKAFNLKSKSKIDLNNQFTYDYNLRTLNERVFEQVWGIFGRGFYDPKMHNLNWKSIYERFKPYMQYADSPAVLSAIVQEMIGDVNASHTGFYPRSDKTSSYKQVALLGLEFNQRKLLQRGMEVSRIYTGSRLYNYYGIRDGDTLLSINGTMITPFIALDSLLADKVDKKLDLVFIHNDKEIIANIKGLSWFANRQLWFQDKIERRKNDTDKLSDNKIGYVQIPRMGGNEYLNFLRDIYKDNADKEALIIDIRGNGGGHLHEVLMDFLETKPNAYSTTRYYGAVKRESPRRTWTKPIVLLIDESSFSDAEIFPQLFKEAKLGKVVGMPTSGSVIGTWEIDLIDGSSMRLPTSGWYRLDGTNMEGNGAQPDIRVEMTPNDIIAENDLQLRKAVEVLLEQIK